jgi:hypothetical protein
MLNRTEFDKKAKDHTEKHAKSHSKLEVKTTKKKLNIKFLNMIGYTC